MAKESILSMRFLIFVGRNATSILILATPLFLGLLYVYYVFLSPVDSSSNQSVYVPISSDADLEEVAESLVEAGAARSVFGIKFLLGKKKDALGAAFKIRSGEYNIPLSHRPSQIVDLLVTGDVVKRRFIVTAGQTFDQIVSSIAQSGLFDEDHIRNAFTNRKLLVKMKIEAAIPEGYFLPQVWTFIKPIKASVVAERVLKDSQEKRLRIFPDLMSRASKLGVDPYKLLTIASLVELNAENEEDKKRVASVIYNRIALGLPLNDEMSLRYVNKDFSIPAPDILKKQESPYNTFIRPGLPATPICTPSLEAIAAALYPKDTDYLYYVKGADGKLKFASTKKEFKKLEQGAGS